MKYSVQIKPISYLKSHTAEIVKDLTKSQKPLLITQNGEAKLVVMDIHSFEEREQTCFTKNTNAWKSRNRTR